MSARGVARLVRVAAIAATLLAPAAGFAHFVLVSPPAAFEQDVTGSPQFDSPCGDNGLVAPTGVVTSYVAGQTIDIEIDETIAHPGHFRVAIALEDPMDLPPDPIVTPAQNDMCATAVIQDPTIFPILADGALPDAQGVGGPQTLSVTLPEVSCDRCTLQVIQFQSSRSSPPCFHWHCAEIRIPEPGAGAGSAAAFLALARRRASRRVRIERA